MVVINKVEGGFDVMLIELPGVIAIIAVFYFFNFLCKIRELEP